MDTNNIQNEDIDILLVESDARDAERTILALTENDITTSILHLKNGREALEYLLGRGVYQDRNPRRKPKAVWLNLSVPEINGLEILEHLRSSEPIRDIPVVVLTSSKEDPLINQFYSLGANSCIVKSVDATDYDKMVASIGKYWVHLNQAHRITI